VSRTARRTRSCRKGLSRSGEPVEQRATAIGEVVDLYGIVALLRALSEHAPAHADTAQGLWRDGEDGSEINDWLWEWLTDYGYDPDQITQITQITQIAKRST
jgi:hypothetical protein